MPHRRRLRRASVVGVLVALVLAAAACDPGSTPTDATPTPTPTKSAKPAKLSFGVFGTKAEVNAFEPIVNSYNRDALATQVRLSPWDDREDMLADLESGTDLPDVFMVSRRDLPQVLERDANVPLFELLDERGVNYGDRYSRDALEAFTADSTLQCLPFSVSPMVIYYNTDLVDFDTMAARGLEVPDPESLSWSFDEFKAAARFGTRPRRGIKGVSIEPTLRSITPFVYSGGGQLFDDDDAPTRLELSDETNRETLTQILELLRDPQLNLTDTELAETTPVQAFKRGKVAMIEGFRSLTPELRRVDGLDFNVMSMPRIDSAATVGDVTGLCIAKGANVAKAADFLVHAISQESLSALAETGYTVPADQSVARSEAFLQPFLDPTNAAVFNASIDSMRLPPLTEDYEELNTTVEPLLRSLYDEPLIDVEAITTQIDELSRSVLDPDYSAEPTGPTGPADPADPSASLEPSLEPSSP